MGSAKDSHQAPTNGLKLNVRAVIPDCHQWEGLLLARLTLAQQGGFLKLCEVRSLFYISSQNEPVHEISNNKVCARSACAYAQSDQSLC